MGTKEVTIAVIAIGCFALSMYGEAKYKAGQNDMASKWIISEIEKVEKRFKGTWD